MRVLWLSVVIIIVDQLSKWLAFTRLRPLNESIRILGNWFKFTYTENPGMAFGVEFGFGPPFLVTLFSIIATVVIVVYLYSVRRGYAPYRVSLALVMGGAVGNIIDRVFYGAIHYNLPLFQGRVVDFIHLDVWRGAWPDWIPGIGGHGFALFPIGNVADLAIIAGVVGILFFQKRFHRHMMAEPLPASSSDNAQTTGVVDPAAEATGATN
ncbi:MAG: signal peptidase II [Rhodothermales bacterium]